MKCSIRSAAFTYYIAPRKKPQIIPIPSSYGETNRCTLIVRKLVLWIVYENRVEEFQLA